GGGAVDVAVHEADGVALAREADGEVDRDRALADAALAGADGDGVRHVREAGELALGGRGAKSPDGAVLARGGGGGAGVLGGRGGVGRAGGLGGGGGVARWGEAEGMNDRSHGVYELGDERGERFALRLQLGAHRLGGGEADAVHLAGGRVRGEVEFDARVVLA